MNLAWPAPCLLMTWQYKEPVHQQLGYIENNVCTRVPNRFSAHKRVILVFISWVVKQRWKINIKKTPEWVQKQFDTRVHTLFYFFHDITNPYMMIKMTIFTHHPHVSVAQFSFCWWCHNRLLMTSQWPDNCGGITWIIISNWLDIDFIHHDIHSWSCKKLYSSS